MTVSIASESHALASDVYALLRSIDPVRWRDGMESDVRGQIVDIRRKLAVLVHEVESDSALSGYATVRERMAEIDRKICGALPASGLAGRRLREAWNDFRLEVLPSYEMLAASLRPLDIHVPSLRPTNYARNAYHCLSGVFAVGLVEFVLPQTWLMPTAVAFAGFAWSCEVLRRRYEGVNIALMKVFGPFAHPHESWRVNSATWFTTALVVLASTGRTEIVSTALMILALADPAAALLGRRFGRTQLVNGRTLEGTSAFVFVGIIAALAVLTWRYPDIGPRAALAYAVAASVGGGLAELFARRIDDNLAIPVGVVIGMVLTTSWL